jgi:gliding motility-associated-like protein
MKKILLNLILLILTALSLEAQFALVEITTTNVSCNSGNNGTVKISITGGTGPYLYRIFRGLDAFNSPTTNDTTYTFSNVTAKNWFVYVEDANLDVVTGTAPVTQPNPIAITSETVTPITCSGFDDGIINITATGESGSYIFTLNPGAVSKAIGNFPGLSPDNYTVTVTDATGCSSSDVSSILPLSDPSPLSIGTEASTDVTCKGLNNGTVSVTATGGTGAYTFTLLPAMISNGTGTFTNRGPGIYTVEVTDVNTCPKDVSGPITVNEPAELIITSASFTNVTCNGAANGTITVASSGGNAPYLFTLTPGGSTNNTGLFTGLAPNNYTVSVTDAKSCGPVTTAVLNLTQPPAITVTSITATDITCHNANDGKVNITATGGNAPLMYTLIPGGSSNFTGEFTGLAQNSYTVSISDAAGCPPLVSPAVIVNNPPALSITDQSSTNATCSGINNGTISVTATGGTGTRTYTLTPGTSNTTGNFTGLAPGPYTVSVTDDNLCGPINAAPFNITQPSPLAFVTQNSTNVTCNGSNNGSITVTASGGTAPYNFTLNPGAIASNSTGSFPSLAPGTYFVTLTDANSCTPVNSNNFTITQPVLISITSGTSTNITCHNANDGTVTVTATGGTAPLMYTLSPGGSSNFTGIFTNLPPNNYSVTVSDAAGCPVVVSPTYIVNNPPALSITAQSSTNATCSGLNNGTISVTATGGTGTRTYTLTPGTSNTTGNFTGLAPGPYTVSVTDENLCGPVNAAPFNITQPSPLAFATETSTNPLCHGTNNGSITVTATGGTAPYNFTLNPGAIASNSTGSFPSLAPGTYFVTLTDANSCTPVNSGNFTITQPPVISIATATSSHITCNNLNNGEIHITATGGTAPLNYTLTPGPVNQANGDFTGLSAGTYNVAVSDVNACPPANSGPFTINNPAAIAITTQAKSDISCFGANNGQITVTASGGTGTLQFTLNPVGTTNTTGVFPTLGPGNYNVSVTDANSCAPANTGNISISEPAAINITVDGTSKLALDCNGNTNGTINITRTGGIPAFTFAWTGPSGFTSSSEDITGLRAGTYNLTVTDANLCSVTLPALAVITEPPLLTISLAKTDVVCNGQANGTITVTAGGGTPPYEYSRNGITYQASNVFSGLTNNNYTIYVRDSKLCIKSASISVSEPALLQVASEIRIDNNKCFGDALGEIRILSVTGGVTPYEYSINNGLSFGSSSNFQNLTAGSYQTVVRDANGCTANGNLNLINAPAAITILNYSQADVTGCFGNINGQIAIEATGGTGAKNYKLDGGPANTTGIFNPVAGGPHTLTITDANACTKDTTITILEPAELVFSTVNLTHVTGCSGNTNGEIDVTATGGSGAIAYAFEGGSFGPSGTFSLLGAGTYQVSALDGLGCRNDTSIILTEPAAITITGQTLVNPSCGGFTDGSISLNVTGGTLPYTFTLAAPATVNSTGTFGGLGDGTYNISVTDAGGCGPVPAGPFVLSSPPALAQDSIVSTEIICSGDNNASLKLYVSGGTPAYQYSIDNQATFQPGNTFTSLAPATYQLSVLDANNCAINLGSVTFTDPAPITVVTETSANINTCFGDATGSLEYTLSGGVGSFSYSLDGLNWQPTGAFNGLTANTYTVQAVDNRGCSRPSGTLTITQPAAISATITTTPDIDAFTKGSITISGATGGTGTLEYSITGPAGPFSAQTVYTGLDDGSYPVVIRDANGCTYQENVVITQVPPLNVTFTIDHVSCFGANDGTITITVTNATGIPEYSIDDSATWSTSNTFSPLTPGSYTLVVRDELNRYYKNTVTVNEPVAITIFSSITPASCSSLSGDGSINVTVIGATGTKTYMWSNGAITEDLVNVDAGTYVLTVTDQNSCSTSSTITLPGVTNVTAFAGNDTSLCLGGLFQLEGTGGTTALWSPPTGLSATGIYNPVATIDSSISYVLTVEGLNDCTDRDTITITLIPSAGLNAGNDTTILKDASVTITTTGGPYTNYNWSPPAGVSDITSPAPVISPLASTTYIVSALNESGCTDTDTITIRIAENLVVYSAFSPNGDGSNDFFDIDNASAYPDIIVEVYARWGEKLFSSKGYADDQRWDGTYKGKDVPIGTYYYIIVPFGGAEPITGPVTIIR